MSEEKTFSFNEDGVAFDVRVFVADDRTIQAKITVTEGSADFNAIYWGDDEEGNSDFEGFSGRDSSLNMNGAGSQYEGEPVEWAGAQKISNPGFGPNSGDKTNYLEVGDDNEPVTSEPITLDGINSLDEIDFLGVRATSVGDDGGSIKAVSPPDGPEPPEDALKIVFYFEDPDEEDLYKSYLIQKTDKEPFTAEEVDQALEDFILASRSDPNALTSGYQPDELGAIGYITGLDDNFELTIVSEDEYEHPLENMGYHNDVFVRWNPETGAFNGGEIGPSSMTNMINGDGSYGLELAYEEDQESEVFEDELELF